MRDGWTSITLGQVTTRRKDFTPVNPEDEYVILGVQRSGWGFVKRDPIKGSDQKFTKLMKVEEDDLVYRTITAFEAPSAVVSECEAGYFVTPQTFPVFKIDSRILLPGFMRLLTTWPQFHDEMAQRCSGTVLRRKTLSVKSFATIPLVLPPLSDQERIVDLINSVDSAIEAVAEQIAAGLAARGYLLEGLLGKLPETTEFKTLGECGSFIRGRRFVKSDYVDEGLACIHYGQIHTHLGSVTTEALTFLPESMRPQMRLAQPGDVVVAATSEDVSGLGKATVWLGEGEVAVHDDAQIFRHTLDPRFASHLFAAEAFHRQKAQYAAGTKVTRISGSDLANIVVPIPSMDIQEDIGETMSALDNSIGALREKSDHLRTLRSNLLTALLSGEHEIPESYNELMKASS